MSRVDLEELRQMLRITKRDNCLAVLSGTQLGAIIRELEASRKFREAFFDANPMENIRAALRAYDEATKGEG